MTVAAFEASLPFEWVLAVDFDVAIVNRKGVILIDGFLATAGKTVAVGPGEGVLVRVLIGVLETGCFGVGWKKGE